MVSRFSVTRAATVMVATGRQRPTYRWHLPAGAAAAAMMALALVAGMLAAMLVHLCALVPKVAAEVATGRHNQQLAQELQLLAEALPAARAMERSLAAATTRTWDHSGLARPGHAALADDPRLLPAKQQLPKDGDGDVALAQVLQQRLRAVKDGGSALWSELGQVQQTIFDRQQLLASTPSIRPARSPWLSSSFGRRLDPLSGQWMMHKGLDLAGPIGSTIVAPADGTVIWTGWRGGYGKTVVIDHGYTLQTHFAHLDAYSVSPGQRVRRGEAIAQMGSTGRSTGPHLHYEVRRGGQPLDPRLFILD